MPSPANTKTLVRNMALDEFAIGLLNGKYHCQYDPLDVLPPVGATAAQKDLHFSVTGTGTVPAPTFQSRGGIVLATRTTSAADNDEARLFPFTASSWGVAIPPTANKESMIETIIIPTQITETQIYFGWKLTDTGVAATDADQALFLFDTDNTTLSPSNLTANANWNCITSVGGVDQARNSGVPVVAASSYHLRVYIGTDRQPRFYINNILVHTGPALTAAANLLPTMGVASRAGAGAAKSMGIRYVRRYTSIP